MAVVLARKMFHSGREMSLIVKAHEHDASSPARQSARKAARTQAISSAPAAMENEVTFQTVDGLESRAHLVHLTRHAATFEADDFTAVLRTSEVLANFKITADSR